MTEQRATPAREHVNPYYLRVVHVSNRTGLKAAQHARAKALAEAMARSAGYAEAVLSHDQEGKPFFPGIPLFVSISHSETLVAVETGPGPVGVDIQYVKPNTDINAISRRFFTQEEASFTEGDPIRFFRIWTKKEAKLKAVGGTLIAMLGKDDTLEAGFGESHSTCLVFQGKTYLLSVYGPKPVWSGSVEADQGGEHERQ